MGGIAVFFLGPMLLTRASRPLTGFEYDKVRALLAYLALEADRPHRREALAGLLWPNQPEKAARDGLRNALTTLRQAIGDDTADPPYLFITREAIQFNTAGDHTLDVAEFNRWLRQAGQHRHRHPAGCRLCAEWRRNAADLYRGPLLAQFSLPDSPEFEHWLLSRRETLHRLAMANFEWLADFYLRQGDSDAARFFAGRQLAYEPWHEPAHRQAMLALARLGDRATALKQYQACVQALKDELDATPEPATTLLFERIRAGLLPQERRVPVVAAPLAPLIGRERDLALLGYKLADPDVRLLTLVGPGGVGKTSLAQQAAHQFGADFADGSLFVSLVTTSRPDGLFTAIAAALGLLIDPSRSIEEQVAEYLRLLDVLVVLDNFEHLLDGAGLLTRLLAAAPGLVLLVTSRRRLNLAAEWLHDLPGLDFPAEDVREPLAGFGALQLFARRARQERGDFALVSAEAAAAAEICRLVQGMPLAIELAAAATGTQPVTEIARQLRAGVDALAVEWADLPPRHRSIHAAIEHSWAMLTDEERRIMRRLSVFSGGFDGAAAEAVAGATPDDLRRLRDKSLLQPQESGRHDLHPLIHAYAAERLAARGETDEAQRQHLAYFTTLAEMGEQTLKGRDQLVWFRKLEADHNNMLAALSWTETWNEAAAARLAAGMWLFWFARGHLNEGRARYERLSPALHRLPPYLRSRVLNSYSAILMGQTDFVRLAEIAPQALAIAQESGDEEAISLAIHHLAACLLALGRLDEGGEMLGNRITEVRRFIAQPEQADNSDTTWILSFLFDDLAFNLMSRGELGAAEAMLNEAIALGQARGDQWAGAYSHLKLGYIYLGRGEPAEAVGSFTRAMRVAEEYGDRRLAIFAKSGLGESVMQTGHLPEATQWAEQSVSLSREIGMRLSLAEALEMLGDLLHQRGHPAEAARHYQEAGEIFSASGQERGARRTNEKLDSLADIPD